MMTSTVRRGMFGGGGGLLGGHGLGKDISNISVHHPEIPFHQGFHGNTVGDLFCLGLSKSTWLLTACCPAPCFSGWTMGQKVIAKAIINLPNTTQSLVSGITLISFSVAIARFHMPFGNTLNY